jgi:CRP/FNR family cyclic AMP-dependent transcriptional regulator
MTGTSLFRNTQAIAQTECKLVPINKKRFAFLVAQTPFFALDVMKVMADRLRRRTA